MSASAADGLRFQRGGSLTSRAHELLAREPLHTSTLATRALGLRGGDAGAAALAVFTLLGDDPRFVVSADGVWSLREMMDGGRTLREESYVVVDVETTGGSPGYGHRITEIAAVRVEGGEVREHFCRLVNPGRRIPRMITELTGISDEMVSDAPPFRHVVDELKPFLDGRVFVAHNAAFDWRFVCAEMERATGLLPAGRQLCTVRLARKLLPQLRSRSLDGLAEYYGLEVESRHRALDDAVATARVLLRFLDLLDERGIERWSDLEVLLGTRAPRRRRTASPRSMESA